MHPLQCALFAAVVTTGVAVTAAPALAQAPQKFPTKPVRIVVPGTTGGPSDVLARLIGPKMSETWGQPVVIESRAGGGGIVGTSVVAKSVPDGYTLLLISGTFGVSAALQANLPYAPLKDFAGVSGIAIGTQVLVVSPALGVRTMKELVALGKAQPGKILFGSSGAGGNMHLWGESVRLAAGIKAVHVGFKGASEAMIEVLTGRVHYAVLNLALVQPLIKDGKLLALAVNTPQRSPHLPDVPTLTEVLPGLQRPEGGMGGGFGLLAPAGTPQPILDQISKEVARILTLPDVKERLQVMGFVPAPSTPGEHGKMLRAQVDALSKLAVDAGLKAK